MDRLKMGLWGGFVLGLALALSACQMAVPTPATATKAAPREIRLSSSGLAVAGPTGFCIDPGSVKDEQGGSFVLLGSCTGLSGGSNLGRKASTAVLTLSVSGPLTDATPFDAAGVQAFFVSDAGRTVLSRSGNMATVTLLGSAIEGGTVFVHARDTSAPMINGLDDEYWRAFFVSGGRLMTATATPFSQAPMSSEGLKIALKQFAGVLARKNPT
ncbi:hypothetical protein [Celeribacter baekdonensis]|uniref:Dihydroxy-acid dehydratase n=1 Tax=Celeribacter baekdonensis TaxID=875171 RepID=A0A2R4M5K6_9RHOB|nr:hypothetical protein [Celeribacter baekdonensis]AVW92332.1 hypothetical protein DA792_15555 [Celeribacter baekdonensis]